MQLRKSNGMIPSNGQLASSAPEMRVSTVDSSSSTLAVDSTDKSAQVLFRPNYEKALAALEKEDKNLEPVNFLKLSPLLSDTKEASQRLNTLEDTRSLIDEVEDRLPNMDKVGLAIFYHYQRFIESIVQELDKSRAPSDNELREILIDKFVNQPLDKSIEKTLGVQIPDLREFKRDEQSNILDTNHEILKKLLLNWFSAGLSRLIISGFFEDLSKSKSTEDFVNLRADSQSHIAQPVYEDFYQLNQKLQKISSILSQKNIDLTALKKASKADSKQKDTGFSIKEKKKDIPNNQSLKGLMNDLREFYYSLLNNTYPQNNEDSVTALIRSPLTKKLSEADQIKQEMLNKINHLKFNVANILEVLKPLSIQVNTDEESNPGRNIAVSTLLVKLLNPINKYFGEIKPLEPFNENSLSDWAALFSKEANDISKEYLGLRLSKIGLAKSLLPENLDILKTTKPDEYLVKYMQLLENVYNNSFIDKASEEILAANDRKDNVIQKPTNDDLLRVGANDFFVKQNNYQIQTMGNYAEKRFLLGLQDLALNLNEKKDLIVIAPNEVGFINNRLGADALLIKKESDGAIKILALDCKSGGQKFKGHPLIKAYTLSHNDLRGENSHKVSLAQKMRIDVNQFFANSDKNMQKNIGHSLLALIPKLDLSDEKIFSNPSENFYRLKDTLEARKFEEQIFRAFQTST